MVLFWCRSKQAQLRALSNQFKRCYVQIHQSCLVIQEPKIHVLDRPSFTFCRTGSEFGNSVRFFAAPVQAKPKYEEKDKGRPRMNEQIHAQYVRLVTDEGHSVVSRNEALDRARKLDLDLVEVQPDGNPPVCKLMDYKKEMYIKQVKEKEQTKQKSALTLRKGGLKEVRITYKIDKHDLKTKADTIKRLAERGHRIKCMAVSVPNENTEKQDLGSLLSRLCALVEDFTLVESGPKLEAKQAYVVVRHIKYGPLKKGPGKNVLSMLKSNISSQSAEEEQSSNESDSETEDAVSKEAMELQSTDDFDQNCTVKITPETPNRYAASSQANGSVNRYAATRPANGSGPPDARRQIENESQSQSQNLNNRQFDLNKRSPGGVASGYGMFTPKPNHDSQRESGPEEVNRYKKGPKPQVPSSRGDFTRENATGRR